LALVFTTGASAVTVTLHPVLPWTEMNGSEYIPRPELAAPPSVVAAGKVGEGEFANLEEHYGWEASDGFWCQWGEIHSPAGQVFNIPNPHGVPGGWLGAPACRSMAVGPDGLLWLTDPGTGSVGRLDPGTGAISEYPIPPIPANLEGYPSDGDNWPTADAIVLVDGQLWVAFADCKCVASVNPNGVAATVASRHHHRSHPR
jgi:hypothetical protein